MTRPLFKDIPDAASSEPHAPPKRGRAASEPLLDKSTGAGRLWLLLLLAVGILGIAAAVVTFLPAYAEVTVLVLLGVMSSIGVFAVSAFLVGVLRFGQGGSDSLLAGLTHGSQAGLALADPDGRLRYANRAYGDILGEPVSPHRAFSHDRDADRAVYRLAQAARAGRRQREDVQVRRPGSAGARAWYRVEVEPVTASGDTLCAWRFTDITQDRDKHEAGFQKLRDAIEYLDRAPAGFLSIKPDGRVAYLNATLSEWLGRDLSSIGLDELTLDDILTGDGAALVSSARARAGETETHEFDLDLAVADGRERPVRLVHKVSATPEGAGLPSHTLVLDRQQSAGEGLSELQMVELRFARVFNKAPIAIATLTAKGELVQANAGFATLFAPGDTPLKPVLELVSEADAPRLRDALDAACSGASVPSFEIGLAGERRARVFLSQTDEGGAQDDGRESVILFAIETTDQRNLEEQFAQAQKMQAVGQLAGGVAHDFNNMLQAILGHAELLLTKYRPSDPDFSDLNEIKQNGKRATALVRQLLAFSRQQTLLPQKLDLDEALPDLSALLRRTLGEKVEFDLVLGRDVWPVHADPNQLVQVVLNLAVNARDAMPDGGKLSINTRNVPRRELAALAMPEPAEPGDYVLIEVTDTGTGIPEDIRDKIFEPFFSTKGVGEGTGLGLATVYGIVQQTGGQLYVESEMGEGTTFGILLPRHEADEEEASEPVAAGAPKADAAGVEDLTGEGTILLVEDEDAVRSFAARALATRGYTVLEASTGAEALEVMEGVNYEVDLVVSDVVMPEMDGPTLLKALRERKPDVKIIFVSGYAEEAFKRNLEGQTDFSFLAKPFGLKQLAQAVKKAVNE